MKKILILVLILLFSGSIFAQKDKQEGFTNKIKLSLSGRLLMGDSRFYPTLNTAFTGKYYITENTTFSQNNSTTKNILFFEIGGNGLFASLNYEFIFANNYGIRIGFGTLLVQGISYPVMVNKYFGEEKKLELGIGIVPFKSLEKNSYWSSKENGYLITTTIGHNYCKSNGGLVLRYSFTPAYNIRDNKLILYFGLSIGTSLF